MQWASSMTAKEISGKAPGVRIRRWKDELNNRSGETNNTFTRLSLKSRNTCPVSSAVMLDVKQAPGRAAGKESSWSWIKDNKGEMTKVIPGSKKEGI